MKRAWMLAMVAGLGCSRGSQAIPDAGGGGAVVRLPPPVRPSEVGAVGAIRNPRTWMAGVDQLVGVRLSPELGLVLGFGIELPVLAAVDMGRPVSFAWVGHGVVLSMTPSSAGAARTTLASRYRLVRDEALGERIEPRGEDAGARSTRGTRCALVVTDDTIGSRVVCASSSELLAQAGRWMAYEAVASGEDDELVVRADAASVRSIVDMGRGELRGMLRSLSASAASARREHAEAPTYGDPEQAVDRLGALGTWALDRFATARAIEARVAADENGLRATMTATLPFGAVADGGVELGARHDHPLTGRLPADAALMLGSRATPSTHRTLWNESIATLFAVLGTRLSTTPGAREDVARLGDHMADAAAFSITAEPGGGVELTALFAQDDGGAGARTALRTLGARPWLRGVTVGGPLRVTSGAEALTVQGTGPEASALVLGVRGDTLAVVAGRHAGASLAAMGPRPARDAVAPAQGEAGNVAMVVYPQGLVGRGAGGRGDGDAVRVDVTSERGANEGAGVQWRGRVVVPRAVVEGVREAMETRRRESR